MVGAEDYYLMCQRFLLWTESWYLGRGLSLRSSSSSSYYYYYYYYYYQTAVFSSIRIYSLSLCFGTSRIVEDRVSSELTDTDLFSESTYWGFQSPYTILNPHAFSDEWNFVRTIGACYPARDFAVTCTSKAWIRPARLKIHQLKPEHKHKTESLYQPMYELIKPQRQEYDRVSQPCIPLSSSRNSHGLS